MSTDISEFDKWLSLLPWEPWLIPVQRYDKKPGIPEGESWKDAEHRLTVEQARQRIVDGLNVGVAATGRDFVFADFDDPKKFQLPMETLTVQTRNGKIHKYFVNGGDVKNADGKGQFKGCGEVRAEWKYVLAPGSYVPPDKDATSEATGLYKVLIAKPPATLYSRDLPPEFRPTLPHKEEKPRPVMDGFFRNRYGWALKDIRTRDKKLDDLLSTLHPPAYPSPSEADMATLSKLLFWGYTEPEAIDILRSFRGRKKLGREDYIDMTLRKVSSTETIVDLVDPSKWNPITGYKLDFEKEVPVVLSHLNMIEDPDLAGKPVIVEAVVSSTSIAYLVPTEVEASLEDEAGNFIHLEEKIWEKDPLNIKLVGVSEGRKQKILNRRLRVKDAYVKDKAWRSVYRIRVRPPVFTLEKRGEKIVDERGFEYKAFDIYITARKPMTFHPSSLIRVEGIALPNPKTQKTTLLAYRVEFPEEVQVFNEDNLRKLKNKFASKSVRERFNWILENFKKYSQIVGRRDLAKESFLAFFTPEWVRFNGEIQRGWGNVSLVGDTTTAKSETLRKMIMLLKAGMLITAETASTVGLTGTTTQVEKEGWFVDWGFLVLCDRRLLAVDGAHKLSLSNWCVLAEAERSGVVTIAKAAKNTAYARTRQIKIANPVDRQADKFTTKNLASFLYPCQALTTFLDKTSIARLDLAAFADQRDVKPEQINVEFEGGNDQDLELLGEALKWCWSGTAEIRFTREAVKTLLSEATKLYNTYFSQTIPLVSIDMKWKLARLSTALAYLTLSTEDFKTLKVTKAHVEEIVEFLKEEYSKAGLNTLAQEDKFEVLSLEDVNQIINTIMDKAKGSLDRGTIVNVFKFIVFQGRVTRDQIMSKFGLSETNQLRPLLAVLSNEKMVRAGRGLYPTPRLVQAYKALTLPRLPRLLTLEKNPPKKPGPQKNGGSFPDLGKVGNLGKNLLKCLHCECRFASQQDLKLHVQRLHTGQPLNF